ncbi:HopJ type III effector protein [Mucilaginibacter sp.]|uniref:HopJ type III effector protein n=1 Tax=Mucilaginibacter sp. TaxID=1882438 RepID=UPI0035BBC48F
MEQELETLLNGLKENSITFKEVIEFIEKYYHHQPTAFKNGELENEGNQNQGSAKVFAFAQLNNLGRVETLQLFAEHYQAVLASPDGTDHQNIRQFMQHGWDGIAFKGTALTLK